MFCKPGLRTNAVTHREIYQGSDVHLTWEEKNERNRLTPLGIITGMPFEPTSIRILHGRARKEA